MGHNLNIPECNVRIDSADVGNLNRDDTICPDVGFGEEAHPSDSLADNTSCRIGIKIDNQIGSLHAFSARKSPHLYSNIKASFRRTRILVGRSPLT